MLWTTLSSTQCSSEAWGTQRISLSTFVHSLQFQKGNLSFEPWFREILRCWGRDDVNQLFTNISQHDAAEFIGTWLEHLQSNLFDMSWARRLMEKEEVHTVDHSQGPLPLMLQFDEVTKQLPTISINTLIPSWHQAYGMIAALTAPGPGICVHLDRCCQLSDSTEVYKCTSQLDCDMEVLLPVFVDDLLNIQYMEYTIVAAQAHIGMDGCGHYRTALKVHPVAASARALRWLLCDDWQRPEAMWDLPLWFRQQITIVWLLRTDQMQLHTLDDKQTISATAQDMLQVLRDVTVS